MTCPRSHDLLAAAQTITSCASLPLDLGQAAGLFPRRGWHGSALPAVVGCVLTLKSGLGTLQGCEMARGGAFLPRDKGAVQMMSSPSCASQPSLVDHTSH